MADAGRKNRFPPLAAIVIALLALLVIIAVTQADGVMRSPDAEVSMPVDLPNDPAPPEPAPTPAPAAGGAARPS